MPMTGDYTDRVIQEWATVRPDLDTTSIRVVSRVLRLARYIETELDVVALRFGLSRKGDFDTLAALRRSGPEMGLSPTQLADAAMITTGGMTGRLDRLEEAGLLERRDDPHDRRAVVVRLTTAGEHLVDQIIEATLEAHTAILAPLDPPERAVLAAQLREILVAQGDS